jgi:hypothetical protein
MIRQAARSNVGGEHEGLQHRGRAALQRRVKLHNSSGLQPRDFARVGRTLLSDAFDVDFALALDFDSALSS